MKTLASVFTLCLLLAGCDTGTVETEHASKAATVATFEARIKTETVQSGLQDGHITSKGRIRGGIPSGATLVDTYVSTVPDVNLQNKLFVGYIFTHPDMQHDGVVFYPYWSRR